MGQAAVVIRLQTLLSPAANSRPLYNKSEFLQTDNFIAPVDHDVIINKQGGRITDAAGNSVKDPLSDIYLNTKDTSSVDVTFADKHWHVVVTPTYLNDVYRRMFVYGGLSLVFTLAVAVFLTVVERQRSQITQEKARTEALIGNIGDGLVASDKDGNIIFVNKKAEDISGFTAREMVGRPYIDTWRLLDNHGNAIAPKERLFYRAMTNKETINISTSDHLFLLRKDDTKVPISSTIAPIIVSGQVTGAIVVYRDISKESEVDRMKTEFLSLVTHQLLTPSTAIRWNLELLLNGDEGPLTKRQKIIAMDANKSNQNMISLVSALLNISRIESGRIIVSPKPTHLPELVDDIVKELETTIKKKKQTFSVTAEKNLPPINIDPILVTQIYKNLMTNAIKYTPAGGNITVTIEKIDSNITSKVIDTGYGIPDKDRARVFDKFYRGDNIVSIEREGNGLGLYLVKQLVTVSGGEIGYSSTEGKGTTFWFTLPLSGSTPKEGEVTIS